MKIKQYKRVRLVSRCKSVRKNGILFSRPLHCPYSACARASTSYCVDCSPYVVERSFYTPVKVRGGVKH